LLRERIRCRTCSVVTERPFKRFFHSLNFYLSKPWKRLKSFRRCLCNICETAYRRTQRLDVRLVHFVDGSESRAIHGRVVFVNTLFYQIWRFVLEALECGNVGSRFFVAIITKTEVSIFQQECGNEMKEDLQATITVMLLIRHFLVSSRMGS